jgi:hypothetical protein
MDELRSMVTDGATLCPKHHADTQQLVTWKKLPLMT